MEEINTKENNPRKESKKKVYNDINNNSTKKGNYSSEMYYKNDLMVNDAVLRDFYKSLNDVTIKFRKENDNIYKNFLSQQLKMEKLEEKITELALEKMALKEEVNVMSDKLENRVKDTTEQFLKVNENHLSIVKKVTETSMLVADIESDMEKIIRKHSLIIENLCPKEDSTSFIMLQVFVKSLGLELNRCDIDNMHLVGSADVSNLPRPFLVNFTCYRTKAQIYSSWLKSRISEKTASVSPCRGQGINIKEYLTAFQETVFKEALKAKEDGIFEDCWTDEGIVYVKKNGVIDKFSQKLLKDEVSRCSIM